MFDKNQQKILELNLKALEKINDDIKEIELSLNVYCVPFDFEFILPFKLNTEGVDTCLLWNSGSHKLMVKDTEIRALSLCSVAVRRKIGPYLLEFCSSVCRYLEEWDGSEHIVSYASGYLKAGLGK